MRLIDADAVIDEYNKSSGTISELMEIILDSPTLTPAYTHPGKETVRADAGLERKTGRHLEHKIIFRGKRLKLEEWERPDTGKWVYGVPLFDWADCSLKCKNQHNGELFTFLGWDDRFHEYEEFEVDPDTVSQYTGRNDGKGTKIFVGDILRADGYLFVVKFGRCGGVQNVKHEVGYIGFYVEPIGDGAETFLESGLRTDIVYWVNAYSAEVVGNVYDNPEFAKYSGTILQ